MCNDPQHILLLEPYYGGSHKAFLIGLQQQLNDCRFTLLSLPARKWKMRMQLAAPWFAERIVEMIARDNNQGKNFDGILTSTFLDVAVLRSLLVTQGIHITIAMLLFATPRSLTNDEARKLTEAYSWPMLAARYQEWLRFKRMTTY
jgi:hypothetical protein